MKRVFGAAVPVAFLLISFLQVGCSTVKESDRQLNEQNIDAGLYVEKNSTDPGVAQAGKDVRENSTTLQKNVFGRPENAERYSPESSEKWRKKSEEEHKVPWLWAAIGSVGTFLLGSTGRAILARLLPTIFGGPVGTGLAVLSEGIARLRQDARVKGSVSEKDIVDTVVRISDRDDVRGYLRKLAHKIEAKNGIDLSSALAPPPAKDDVPEGT